jgi:hypothetical protein
MERDVPSMFEWVVLRNIPRSELQIRAAAFTNVFAPPFTLAAPKRRAAAPAAAASAAAGTDNSAGEQWHVEVLALGEVQPTKPAFHDRKHVWCVATRCRPPACPLCWVATSLLADWPHAVTTTTATISDHSLAFALCTHE